MAHEFQHAARSSRAPMHVKIPVWRALAMGGSLAGLGVALGIAVLPFVAEPRRARIEAHSPPQVSGPSSATVQLRANPAVAAQSAPAFEQEVRDGEPITEPISARFAARSTRAALRETRATRAEQSVEARAGAREPNIPAESARAHRASRDCEPSFVLDEQGRKHFKPECLSLQLARSSARAPERCEPNFELDEHGRKHFKPECFLTSER